MSGSLRMVRARASAARRVKSRARPPHSAIVSFCRGRMVPSTWMSDAGCRAEEREREPRNRRHPTLIQELTMAALRVILLLVASATLSAQNPQPKTIEIGDINRSADPCADFFEYANGAWRAQNPIPASMPRWSRRWAAGEANKEQLQEHPRRGLGEADDQPKGSRRAADWRLLRARAWTRRASNALGAKPIAAPARTDRRDEDRRRTCRR